MPGSASERVQQAKNKDAAKKASRKQRLEKERLAQKQNAAIVLLQCAARRRAAMRLAAEQRHRLRTPELILEERRAEWLAQRRSINRPGYSASFVSSKLAEQERLRYPWVRQALTAQLTAKRKGAERQDGSSAGAPSAARASFRELSRRHFSSLYLAANAALDTSTSAKHGDADGSTELDPAPKPRSPKRDRSGGKRTPFTSIDCEQQAAEQCDGENMAPQSQGAANGGEGGGLMGGISSPSMMLKRLSSTVRRVSKEAMGLLSA